MRNVPAKASSSRAFLWSKCAGVKTLLLLLKFAGTGASIWREDDRDNFAADSFEIVWITVDDLDWEREVRACVWDVLRLLLGTFQSGRGGSDPSDDDHDCMCRVYMCVCVCARVCVCVCVCVMFLRVCVCVCVFD